ncbi:MAG: VCBS repeat-containing protein, partial [Thermoplasmata archaeon]|nr:VCBS repeat-containing protein [Thermoplasmata archaeon]
MWKRKILTAIILFFFMPLLSLLPSEGTYVDTFSGGVREKVITLQGERSPLVDASLYFTIDPGVSVASARLNVSTVNADKGPWLKNPEIDFGLDQRPEWAFSGNGYGEFGHQTHFSDDKDVKTLRVTTPGGVGTPGSIILPYGAQVISAKFNLTGRFIPEASRHTSYSASSSPAPSLLSTADFDGDNFTDAAVVLGSAVYSYTQNGSGWSKRADTSGFSSINAITTGDYDGDGDDDIAFYSPDSGKTGIYVLNNTASGVSFTQSRINSSFSAKYLLSADVDDDGRDEIIGVLNYYSSSTRYIVMFDYNNSAWSSWVIGKSSSSDSGHYVYGLRKGDFNNDGWMDVLIYQSNPYNFYWFENPANASFYSNTSNRDQNWTRHLAFSGTTSSIRFDTADFDKDGYCDIVYVQTYYRSSIILRKNPGSSGSWSSYTIYSSLYYPSRLAVGDIDNDTYPDVALVYYYSPKRLVWFDSGGNPTSTGWTMRTIDTGLRNPSLIEISDMDGDNDGDVILLDSGEGQVVIYINSGSGDGTAWSGAFVEMGALKDFRGMKPADMDDDGDSDLVVAVFGTGIVVWFENDGTPFSGTWPLHVISPGRLSGPYDLDVGDIDNDGDLDVVVALQTAGDVIWLENPGDPMKTFTKHVVTTDASYVERVLLADVDSDGDLDTLFTIYDYYSGGVFWCRNVNPTGSWVKYTIKGASYCTGLDVGDIDKDGDLDVVYLYGGWSGSIAWAINPKPSGSVTGSWSSKSISGGLYYPRDVELYDIDGDGLLDAVVTDTYRNSVKWFHCPSNPAFASSWNRYTIGTGISYPWMLSVGDVGNDGYPDVVVSANYPWGSWGRAYGIYWYEIVASPFATWERHTLDSSTANTWDVAFVDLDNNSVLDVAYNSRRDNVVRCVRVSLVYPTSPFVDLGSDSVRDWQYTGTLSGVASVDLTSSLN